MTPTKANTEKRPVLDCRAIVRASTEHTVKDGESADWIEGTVCDECGESLDSKELALARAVEAQQAYWDALEHVEDILDINLDDFSGDLSNETVDSLLEEYGESDDEEDARDAADDKANGAREEA